MLAAVPVADRVNDSLLQTVFLFTVKPAVSLINFTGFVI
jgi:hypothetical protein